MFFANSNSKKSILFVARKTYGNLKDSDRIFTNLYRDGDPFINGAMRRGDWHNTKDILRMG